MARLAGLALRFWNILLLARKRQCLDTRKKLLFCDLNNLCLWMKWWGNDQHPKAAKISVYIKRHIRKILRHLTGVISKGNTLKPSQSGNKEEYVINANIMNNAQSIPSVPIPPRAFVILSVPAVGDLSENLCPRVGHSSILPEVVYILPFSIFHLKICLFR